MLFIACAQCGSTQMIGYSNLVSLDNTPDGPVVTAHCQHGHLTRTRYTGAMPTDLPTGPANDLPHPTSELPA